ncbi:MAG: ABC transporter permease [Rhizobiaceae bacterium]|nr:ABC transporter permease [Rhizobiaceae bacterium]
MIDRIRAFLPPQFLLILPATIILFAVSPLLAQGSVSASSLLTVLSFAGILAIAATGQTLVIQQGGLDLSVPGVISLAAVLVSQFPLGSNASLPLWIAMALASGMISGVICGIAITRFFVTPLVATLAVNALLYGTVFYLTKGTSTNAVPSLLSGFAVGRAAGIPYLALFALAAIVIVEVFVRATVVGRRFVAVGTSARAARAAGMRVTGYKIATYAAAGFFYALAGVLLAGYLGVPSLLVGHSYLLPVITVVVLGGTSLLGGAGSVAATGLGAIFLVQLQQLTIGLGAPTSAQFIIQALIIILGMSIRLVPWQAMLRPSRRPQPAQQLAPDNRDAPG